MKKYFIVLVISMLCISSTLTATAAEKYEPVKVFVNQVEVLSEPSAILYHGTTCIPFRAILNALGIKDSEITWHDDSKSIEIKTDTKYVFMAIGNSGVIVDRSMTTLKVAPFIYEGRTYIPLRGVSEILGAEVEWNAIEKAAYITK